MHHTRYSKENKVLLILDGHKSHTRSIELIDYCREHGVVMTSLPPHTLKEESNAEETFAIFANSGKFAKV